MERPHWEYRWDELVERCVLRAAVIGLGVGEQHVGGYAEHPACELVAICDIDPARLREVAARHPGACAPRPTPPSCSTTRRHRRRLDRLLRRRPLRAGADGAASRQARVRGEAALPTPSEAREIAALLAERPELRLSTNVPLRRSPALPRAARADPRGRARARCSTLEGDYDYGRRHKLTDGWRGAEPAYYSVVLGGAIHLVDLLLWLTGERPVTEVTAAVGNGIATRGTRVRPDDLVVAVLRCPSGAT